jgi:small subunit ribosomal protein S12e
VIKNALVVDGVRRGLHESLKALAKGDRDSTGKVAANGARLVILAADCEEAAYKKVVKALAQEKGTPLIEIGQAMTLGEWCVSSAAAAAASTSCAVITDFGVASSELGILGVSSE